MTPLAWAPSAEATLLPVRSLPLSHIRLNVDCGSETALFEAVAEAIAGHERLRPEQVVQRLSSRHRRSSSAIGLGWALPHAAVPAITAPLAVYLRLRRPLRLRNDDVSDCLALLAPAHGFTADHEMLRRISAFLRQPETSEALRASTNASDIRRLLTGHE